MSDHNKIMDEITNTMAAYDSVRAEGYEDPMYFMSDMISSAIKYLNQNYPDASITRKIDDAAYKIASDGSTSGRSMSEIVDILRRDEPKRNPYKGAYGGTKNELKELPDLLKIYMGMDENTLPKSKDIPTSFTGAEDMDWYSIGDYTNIEWVEPSPQDYDYSYATEYIKRSLEDVLINKNPISLPGFHSKIARLNTKFDLGKSTKSMGYDPEKDKYYISMTDIWDFEPKQYEKGWGYKGKDPITYLQASLMDAVGDPIGIYDRYYIPDDVLNEWIEAFRININDDVSGKIDLFTGER